MASIVLATAGTALGTAVGGPIGGAIGGQLGAGLGGMMSGTTKRHYEGARLEELSVQSSTYGRMIPMVFGSVRMAGNVIWSRPIQEMATTTTVTAGGKGGAPQRSKTSSTEYSYSVTLAIAICEGEITRVDRVWADAKLLDLSQGTYRIYTGSETQLPDPFIESYQGVGATPSYRGLAYVVIEDFPLEAFGNRIPNFTFEVTRHRPQVDGGAVPVESQVTSIMLIPASGEVVYDTVARQKSNGSVVAGQWVQSGYKIEMNQHNAQGKANVLLALDQLQETLPNLEWVGVACNWFGTSMDIASCEIWPGVEYASGGRMEPTDWSVAGLSRGSAHLVGSDSGVLRYGGTPDDASILHLVVELRARGLKIFFYPMLQMDLAGKPWRGEVTGAASDVSNFFTKTRGYNAFITYYANLLVGKIDAFAIGTEMRDLTKITSSAGVFPAVSQLVTLASIVRGILGSGVKLTYAADWSEYHHTDGGWYHLDPLWASSAIDMVGIDAYFPLSDAPQTAYDVAALQAGWVSGEGYDWVYTDATRTSKTSLAAAYAWKNISYWWSHTHTNPNSSVTAWTPQMKPIWFTEYGFASVDGCANQPNVFVDASNASSAYPRFSKGRVDFMAQRAAIAATEAQWGDNAMVARRFLWTWDARPYPYWPDLSSVWADGGNWVTGHWVQGKLGTSHVAAAVEEILARAGIAPAAVDVSAIQLLLDGFILSERTSARAVLEQLMRAYFFELREREGGLIALPRTSGSVVTIPVSDCIPIPKDGRELGFLLERAEDLVLPQSVEVHSLNRLQRYATQVQTAARGTQSATDTAVMRVSLVLSDSHAQAIAQTALADRWAERVRVQLRLPMRYAALEVGDRVVLDDAGTQYPLRITQIQLGKPGMARVEAVMDAAEAWDGYIAPTLGHDGVGLLPLPNTAMEILDIPCLPTDNPDQFTLKLAVCGQSTGWQGATVLRINGSGEDEVLAQTATPAVMGSALTVLGSGSPYVVDGVNTVDVALLAEGTLSSVTLAAMLGGANAALLGGEVIQFTTATLIGAGQYRLSGLLRGRLGTEAAIASHAAGERFVLLSSALLSVKVAPSTIGQRWNFRAVTAGKSLGDGTEAAATLTAQCLTPWAPVLPSAVRSSASNDVTFSWLRRTRQDGGLRDGVEIPLLEAEERYRVRVYNGATLVREWSVTTANAPYSAAQQLADFGSYPSSFTVEIAEISAAVGAGKAWSGVVHVRVG